MTKQLISGRRVIIVIWLLMLSFSGVTDVSAKDISIIVPGATDQATNTFLETFKDSSLLRERDLKFNSFDYGELVPPSQTPNAVLTGQANLALITSTMLPGLTTDNDLRGTALISYPGIATRPNEKFQFEDSVLGDVVAIELGKKGFVFLSFWDAIPTSIVTRQAINLNEIAGLKISTSSQRAGQLIAELGASPQQIAFAEIATSIQLGAIDGAELVIEEQSIETLKTLSGGSLIGNFNQRSGYLLANSNFWVSLSEAERQAIQLAALEAQEASRSNVRQLEDRLPSIARENKLVFASFSDVPSLRLAAENNWKENFDGISNEALTLLQTEKLQSGARPRETNAKPIDQSGSAPVLFFSTRNEEESKDLRLRFGIKHDDDANLACDQIYYDANFKRKFGAPYKGKMRSISATLSYGAEKCTAKALEAARKSGNKLTFFIHGYNNSFSDAINRAVSISQDLKLNEPLVLWTWASEGTISGYVRDRSAVDLNREYLKRVVQQLSASGDHIEITLLAHSMGSKIGLEMLERFSDKGLKLANAVFVAPDVTQPIFKQSMRNYAKASALVSFYSNAHDRPLYASKIANKITPAGLGGKDLLVLEQAETIDVSAVDDEWVSNNHSHAFDVPQVAADARSLLKERKLAATRGLNSKTLNGLKYYIIKE